MAHERTPRTYTLADVQANKSLWYRLHVYAYDLRNFTSNNAARDRLNNIVDVSYLGQPYFSPSETEILENTCVDGGSETLKQRIQSHLNQQLNRRKDANSSDFRVCAGHDLAPIFEKAFGINPKKLAKNSKFGALIRERGLELQDRDDVSFLVKKGIARR